MSKKQRRRLPRHYTFPLQVGVNWDGNPPPRFPPSMQKFVFIIFSLHKSVFPLNFLYLPITIFLSLPLPFSQLLVLAEHCKSLTPTPAKIEFELLNAKRAHSVAPRTASCEPKLLSYRGRPNFVFFLFFGARKRIGFIFRRFIFRPIKTSAFSFLFFFWY